jgi:hypothetical protein
MRISKPKLPYKKLSLLLILLAVIYAVYHIACLSFIGSINVWLPKDAVEAWPDGSISLIDASHNSMSWSHGRAVIFTSSNGGATIYEARQGHGLQPSKCPNLFHEMPLDPSGCSKVGTIQGSPVYSITRSDGTFAEDGFVTLGNTFVAVVAIGPNAVLNYLQKFEAVSKDQIAQTLTNNKAQVDKQNAVVQAKANAEKRLDAKAYINLPFTPSLPKSLPAGWHLLTNITTPAIQIDGPDVGHPMMVSLDYATTNSKGQPDQYVSLHEIQLSASRLGSTCGPTPGESMKDLPCTKVAGTSYYQATAYDANNALIRYLYYPLGDSLIISDTTSYVKGEPKQTLPANLAAAQEMITLNVRPVDKAALKGSIYSQTYY